MKLNGITTMLTVPNVQQTIDFYTETLGFECIETWAEEEKVVWANVQAGQANIMLSAWNDHEPAEPSKLTGLLYCYTNDVDDLWHRLKDQVEVAWPLETMPYGLKEFAIKDCNGYTLSFGQEVDRSNQ